jgi:hypothetical protein
MATYSKKMMGKEVGDAKVYAKPHTMEGKTLSTKDAERAVEKKGNGINEVNMSVGGFTKNPNPEMNKHGEKTMRGYGAATKGIKTRGPMA